MPGAQHPQTHLTYAELSVCGYLARCDDVLYGLVTGHREAPTTVRAALQRLRVSLACVSAADARARGLLGSAVRAPLEPHGSMQCHVGLIDEHSGA